MPTLFSSSIGREGRGGKRSEQKGTAGLTLLSYVYFLLLFYRSGNSAKIQMHIFFSTSIERDRGMPSITVYHFLSLLPLWKCQLFLNSERHKKPPKKILLIAQPFFVYMSYQRESAVKKKNPSIFVCTQLTTESVEEFRARQGEGSFVEGSGGCAWRLSSEA